MGKKSGKPQPAPPASAASVAPAPAQAASPAAEPISATKKSAPAVLPLDGLGVSPLPQLDSLHERHTGYPQNLCGSFADAARVCLARHHESPQTLRVQDGEVNTTRSIGWIQPTPQVVAAWNNSDDATRDGAYAVSLAAVESLRSLVTVGRARSKSGADWLLVPKSEVEPDDFEGSIRLEVSGVDTGTLGARFSEKVKQAQAGDSPLPAIVSVVGFEGLRVRIGDVAPPS